MGIGGFTAVWSFLLLRGLALGKAVYAFGEPILGDQLRPAHPVLRLGRERGVAARVEIERDDLGDPVTAHVQRLAVLQALEQRDLLLVHLEQLGIPLPVERGVLQEQERCAGVHDGIGVLA